MEKTINTKGLSAILIALFFLSFQGSFAQEITEENYVKVDKEIWEQYERDTEEISKYYDEFDDRKDSLKAVFDEINDNANRKNRDAAIKFASVPSGLQRLYMVRLEIPKDTLASILSHLSDSTQTSAYGKSILKHLGSKQIEEGDPYYDFEATDSEGKDFTLSSLKGRNILLLYGGLGCMGEGGRNYLKKIYSQTSRASFEIVVYSPNSDLEGLQKVALTYPCDYFLVSDFLQDHTPVKILYGAQATPTCFFVDKKGTVVMKSVGLDTSRVDKLLGEN